jgi:Polyketide cyclase / dehydrase and lipid transport
MTQFRESVTIAADAADVARVILDVERWPSWTTSMTSVRRHGTGPLAVGEQVTVKQPRLPVGVWTVTALDGTGFRWTSSAPGLRSTGEHWVADAGDGRSTATLALVMTGPMAGVTGVLFGRLIRRYVRMEAAGLRRAVGSGPTA